MAKVAANQERARALRSAYVYQQSLRVRFLRTNGKLAREENREYLVTPTPSGTEKKLARFSGRYSDGKRIVEYDQPGHTYKDLDLDGDLVSDLADDLANDENSRDGIQADLFPLTSKEQQRYAFKLAGTDVHQGREVYRVTFRPAGPDLWEGGVPWAGEVLVDTKECQPMVVTTWLSKGIPLWVKTVLGTDIKHLGFKVTYQRFDDGVWFPVSYGGEFELKGLFFYKRKISVALRNEGFERADVSSTVRYASPER
jgi:hypothetical protein